MDDCSMLIPYLTISLTFGASNLEEDENECKLHVEFEMLRWGGTTRDRMDGWDFEQQRTA